MKKTIVFAVFAALTLLNPLSAHAVNNCLDFAGNDDCITVSSFSPTMTSGTISFWIRLDSTPTTNARIISKSWGHDEIFLKSGTGVISTTGFVSGDDLESSTGIPTQVWTHVAITADGSGSKLYINGILEDTGGAADFSYSNVRIGGQYTSFWEVVPGQLDEVRFWNIVRTEAQIRQNMYREIDPSTSGLIAYYRLNESDGTTTATDSAGSNNGTLTNMTGNEWQTSPAMFGPKNSLEFDGRNEEYVTINSNFGLGTSNFSVECWAYIPSTDEKGTFLNVGGLANGYGIGVGYGSFDDFGNELIVIFDMQTWQPTGDNIGTGWHHVAFTVDGSQNTIVYLDGRNVHSFNYTIITPSDASYIGTSGPTNRWLTNGRIDEVRIWNDVRTETELRENMCKMLTGNEQGLAAYYSFDNTSGTTLQNFTASTTYDGTLNNMENSDWVSSSAFNTWLNTSSSAWSTSTNWSRGSTPGSSDNVGVYSYAGGTNVVLSGSPTVTNLLLGGSSAMTLSSGLTVNGNLILESDLALNDRIITLGASGYLIEDGGLLNGVDALDTGTITTTRSLSNPSSENVAGLGATLTAAWDLGSTTVTRGVAAQTGAGNTGIKRYFDISPTNNSGSGATLVFHYEDTELNDLTESKLLLYKSTDGGDTWTQVSASRDTSANTLTATGLTSFSRWTAGDSDDPLLIDLVSFTATGLDDAVRLNWETASEIDTAGFHLLRSTTKTGTYNSITASLILAKGSATSGATYTLNDTDVTLFQAYYYKLECVSTAGNRNLHGPLWAAAGGAVTKEISGSGTIHETDTADGMGAIEIAGTGPHTVTTGRYADNPAGPPGFTPTGDYWFMDVTDRSGVSSLNVRFCPANSADTVYYWDGIQWASCSKQRRIDGCIEVTITDATSPQISDLDRMVFALGQSNAAIPTLSQWGMILLSVILGAVGLVAVRRKGSGLTPVSL
jgi:hypothetical protein